ncbi:hypothetical protein [Tissierella sp. Yu-01]|nr:hypothetical protein [Tissierella sp. Yu-01]WFA08765.1 hypothetical protein P3962_13720 [Tissierella sp. Yu-01]
MEMVFGINVIGIILNFAIKVLGVYALVLFIKAVKIYINKNNI